MSMTIQNVSSATIQARAIYHYRSKVSPDTLIDLDVQTCKDVPDAIGAELITEFPFLQIIAHTPDVAKKLEKIEEKLDATVSLGVGTEGESILQAPDMIAEMNAGLPIVCNQCGKHCKSIHGRNLHISKSHKT